MAQNLDSVLTKRHGKKKYTIAAVLMAFAVFLALVVFFFGGTIWENLRNYFHKVTDITVDGDQMTLNVHDRTFYVYDKLPSETDKDEEPPKKLREIHVSIEGTADLEEETFDGTVAVEGYELHEEMDEGLVGYTAYKSNEEDYSGPWIYNITAMGIQKGAEHYIQVEISEDLREIQIIVHPFLSNEEKKGKEEPISIYSKY